MSLFLKISFQGKHKKYRYLPQRAINFNQIKRQLYINNPSENYHYLLQPEIFKKDQENIILNQQQLVNYLKSLKIYENQTVKLKMVQKTIQTNSSKLRQSNFQQDMKALGNALQRMKSKSDEVDLKSNENLTKTDTIQVTRQFLCNSQIDYYQSIKSKQVQQLQKQIVFNQKRRKILNQRRRCTNITKLNKYYQQVLSNQELRLLNQ